MVKKIQMFGGVRESIMKIFRCHIKKISGYISLGNQRDLILDWIKKRYQVADVLANISASELRDRSRKLAGLLFGIKKFNHAPRGIR